jgi:PAS domain S-box-containing protein
VTAAKRMDDQIRESVRHMRELLEALPAAVYTTDAKGRITFYNKATVDMAGRTPEPGDEWCVTWHLFQPDGTPLPHDECPMAIALKENRPIRGMEAVAERPDGTRVPFLPFPTPLRDSNGKLVGAINMLVDITERKEAEARQKVLIDELNHRVKNTLALVQSLVAQTARHAGSLSDFSQTFEARLLALARAHDLLTKRQWQDAPLGTLIREVLAPLAGDRLERMRIEGPSTDISPRFALSLTMALNELLTNAVKYGALSSTQGTLSVGWDLRQHETNMILDLKWQERGGPPVTPPARRGFGTRLIERCIERDLAGEFDLAFEREGVSCRMAIPITDPGSS